MTTGWVILHVLPLISDLEVKVLAQFCYKMPSRDSSSPKSPLLAHAKDASARAFFEKWGFSSTDRFPLHLSILTKDSRATLGR